MSGHPIGILAKQKGVSEMILLEACMHVRPSIFED